MSLSRNEARVKSMIILYQGFLCEKNKIDYDIDNIIKNNLDEEDDFVYKLVFGIIDNRDKIENIANKYLGSWPINRLGLTDRAIIDIAIYELLFTDIDGKIAINEAIIISKKYSDDRVVKIINGVLDKIYNLER